MKLKTPHVQKHANKEEQKCNKCGKIFTRQTFCLSHVLKCNVNSSKGETKTPTAYEDIISTEDASFVEQQNTTSAEQEHAVDIDLFCLSYFHEDLQSDSYEVP